MVPSAALRRASRWLLAMVANVSCALHLDGSISCGDGVVDRAAGEECDPGVESSFAFACQDTLRPAGTAACDPVTCTIDTSIQRCGVCGDGIVDAEIGEQCDGDNLDGKACPPPGGSLQCQGCRFDLSGCETCGNGKRDAGEACDPEVGLGGIGQPVACASLAPPNPAKPYVSGTVQQCKSDCDWWRGSCSYCGDGVVDEKLNLDVNQPEVLSAREVCDGLAADPAQLVAYCAEVCASAIAHHCSFVCRTDCAGFAIEIAPPDPGCCRLSSQPCPTSPNDSPCCYEPKFLGDPTCEAITMGGQITNVCR